MIAFTAVGSSPPISRMPRLRSPATAAATVKPSSATPSNDPDVIFHAMIACRPIVSASLFMMQPPANTSAVRASTYSPVMRAPGSAVSTDAPGEQWP